MTTARSLTHEARAAPARVTTVDVRDVAENWRGRTVRRAAIAALTIIVLAGSIGMLGVRSARAIAERDAYRLEVTYGAVSRAGLDTPWQVVVTHPGGFDGPVTLATTAGYFDIFESQGLTPEPVAETATARFLYQSSSRRPATSCGWPSTRTSSLAASSDGVPRRSSSSAVGK